MGGRWWVESFPRTPSYRVVCPPRPVIIELAQAVARDNPSLRTVLPLRVTAGGVQLTGDCPGWLHAWLRVNTRVWLAQCTFTAHSGNRRATLTLRQWVPASAVRPR